MPFFIEIDGLSELEKQGKWDEARVMLYELWISDRENLDFLLRLFSECWYTLCEWGVLEVPESVSYQAFKDTLIECTEYGLTHFNKDARFMWMAGYMISMFPDLFFDADVNDASYSDLYLKWESEGKEMLALLCKQDPADLMAKVMHLGNRPGATSEDKEYREAKRKFAPLAGEYFPNDTDIEIYFNYMFKTP